MNDLFFELLQVASGHRRVLSYTPDKDEWYDLYRTADMQTLIGICFSGIKKLEGQDQKPPADLYMQWLSSTAAIQQRNELMNVKCSELQNKLHQLGYKSCILKGQGIAYQYPQGLGSIRQSGDIDVWLEGGIDSLLALYKSMGWQTKITEQHGEIVFFDGVEVEVHYRPSMLKDPFANRILQKWFKEQETKQFSNVNTQGLCVPTTEFNLVYLLIHIYRHLFGEGVGLRQLMDYYAVLFSTNDKVLHKRTMKLLHSMHLHDFAGGLMWVLQRVYLLEEERLLCVPNEKHGRFLLNEILRSGNMGKYDDRLKTLGTTSKLKHFIYINRHTFRLLRYYPRETLFAPLTRIWIWMWRKKNGWN